MVGHNYMAYRSYLCKIIASNPSVGMAFWNNPITHCVMT